MKRLILVLAILALASPVFAGFGTTIIDGSFGSAAPAECTTSTDSVQVAFATSANSSAEVSGTSYRGQFFTLAAATTITGVSLTVIDGNTDTGSVTCHLFAYDTSGDAPTGSSLASVTVNASDISGTSTEHFFAFSSAYSATAGDYCIYFIANDSAKMSISRTNTGVAGTAAILSSNSGSTWAEQAYDYLGEGVYGCSD